MTVDYRKLLKDCIRGMIIEWDIPAVPIASWHEDGEDSTREELELFFELVAEVRGEDGEPRQFVLDDMAGLERDYLGDGRDSKP